MYFRDCLPSDLAMLKQWDPFNEMWLEDYTVPVNDPERKPFICMDHRGPIGWAQMKNEDGAYILSWFVTPKYRHMGIGKEIARLLANFCGLPIKAKINITRLHSERIAISLGMKPVKLLLTGEKWWVKDV